MTHYNIKKSIFDIKNRFCIIKERAKLSCHFLIENQKKKKEKIFQKF
jgi:hypothetical protein